MDWRNPSRPPSASTASRQGGFIVDLWRRGVPAGSQVDIRPVRDVTPLMGTPQPFQILKMDAQRNNIVVSRRSGRDPFGSPLRAYANLSEGQCWTGWSRTSPTTVRSSTGASTTARHGHRLEAYRHPSGPDRETTRFRSYASTQTQRIAPDEQLEADPQIAAKYPSTSSRAG